MQIGILRGYNKRRESRQVETNIAAFWCWLGPSEPWLHKVLSFRSMFKGLSVWFDHVHICFAQIKQEAQCELRAGQRMCRYTDGWANSGQLIYRSACKTNYRRYFDMLSLYCVSCSTLWCLGSWTKSPFSRIKGLSDLVSLNGRFFAGNHTESRPRCFLMNSCKRS